VMVSGWRTRDEPVERMSEGAAPPLFEPESL
jgi:hypothetical protein